MKKHIPNSGYEGWTHPSSLFEQLTEEEREALDGGAEIFRKRFANTLLFPDPFFVKNKKSTEFHVNDLRIVHGGDAFYRELGLEIAAGMRDKWKIGVPVLEVNDPPAALSSRGPKLLLGGGDVNSRSFEIARKYQLGVFSSEFPGVGGWGLTSHWELEAGFAPCYIFVCDPETQEIALDAVLERTASPEGRLRWTHRVSPGRTVPEKFHDFDLWISSFQASPFLDPLGEWLRNRRDRPYRSVFKEFFTQREFPEGLPNNSAFLDLGIDAIRYYQCTGSEEALDLFREMLWGFWDYLNAADPQIYISDMDFRLGAVCNYWNWIQHHPSITEEERVAFDQLLLAAMRMVCGYFRKLWKRDPQGPPHNHQTFKARSLILGWRYFRDANAPDIGEWRQEADSIFECVDPDAFKHSENANNYETFVPEHTLVWHEAINRPIPDAMRDALAKVALREWAMRDNFLFPVDYGDCDPKLVPGRPFEVSPWLTENSQDQRTVNLLEASGAGLFPVDLPPSFRGFTGLHRVETGIQFSGAPGWQRVPLDPVFAKKNAAKGAADELFDKLVWRSGWKLKSAYLAIEGIGNETVSHAHNEANGILRMNLGGRIWLVSNGYGRSLSMVSAAKSFSSRQRGPEEHNMLVVRDGDSGEIVVPPVNARLRACGTDPLPFSVSQLADYGGLDWFRYIIILPETGFVVADRMVRRGRKNKILELQWNILGSLTPGGSGAVVEQSGVALIWEHFGTAVAQWKESKIAAWNNLLKSGAYPHTAAMPMHGIQKITEDAFEENGEAFVLNGFWLKGSIGRASWSSKEKALSLVIKKDSKETTLKAGLLEGGIEISETLR